MCLDYFRFDTSNLTKWQNAGAIGVQQDNYVFQSTIHSVTFKLWIGAVLVLNSQSSLSSPWIALSQGNHSFTLEVVSFSETNLAQVFNIDRSLIYVWLTHQLIQMYDSSGSSSAFLESNIFFEFEVSQLLDVSSKFLISQFTLVNQIQG